MYCITSELVKLRTLMTCRNHFKRDPTSLREKTNILNLVEEMPRRARIEKSIASGDNTAKIMVLGSGAEGVPACVALKMCPKTYLINCGEGTQKLINEYRVKFLGSPDIFITSPTWKNISGLLGVTLSLQDSHVANVNIHGHRSIEQMFSSVNKFINLRTLQVNVLNCSHYKEYTDGLILVRYVFLHSSKSVNANKNVFEPETVTLNVGENSEFESGEESSGSTSSSVPNEEENVRKQKRKKKMAANKRKVMKSETCETEGQQKPAVSYIFSMRGSQGKLNVDKCYELGVPPGPLLGKLKSGRDVILPNGLKVRSKDVKSPDMPGIHFIVLECPSEEFLDSLENEPLFSNYQTGENVAAAVVHFTSARIVKNLRYQNWIKRFPQETKHLFINEDNKMTGSVGIHRQQFKLNMLDPEIFPLLHDPSIPDYPRKENCSPESGQSIVPGVVDHNIQIYSDSTFYKCETNNFITGETLCTLYLKPKKNYDYSKCLVLKKDEFLKEVYESNSKEKIDQLRYTLQDLNSNLQPDKGIYPKIVFLGTGSGKPSKVRNSSGILIFTEKDKCILFDCGENTYNQLIHLYGVQRCKEILRNLIAIFVSHLHVDHHFGLVTLLIEKRNAFLELSEDKSEASTGHLRDQVNPEFKPVYLLAPVQLTRWLQMYNDEFGTISDLYHLIGNNFLGADSGPPNAHLKLCLETLNIKSMLTVSVRHGKNAYGIAMVHADGWKVTYSGDTRPCEKLVKIGMDSDILIHEATFEDAFWNQAVQKLHSTTYEAIDVGKKMRAKYILLTHFSQRYCYLPNIEEKFPFLNVGIAFDFMEVPFYKLPILPALLYPLKNIFREFHERVKDTAQAELMKAERMSSKHIKNDLFSETVKVPYPL